MKFQEGKFGLNMHIVEQQCTPGPVSQFLSTAGIAETSTLSGVSSMGNGVFAAMTQDLKQTYGVVKFYTVSVEDYEAWRYGYLFDALQNLRYGQSFCNAFDITDNVLFYEKDRDWADNYIRKHYVR